MSSDGTILFWISMLFCTFLIYELTFKSWDDFLSLIDWPAIHTLAMRIFPDLFGFKTPSLYVPQLLFFFAIDTLSNFYVLLV